MNLKQNCRRINLENNAADVDKIYTSERPAKYPQRRQSRYYKDAKLTEKKTSQNTLTNNTDSERCPDEACIDTLVH